MSAPTTIDFVYMGGYCPTDGCPEVRFKHKSSFATDYERQAFLQAMETIRKYIGSTFWNTVNGNSPLKNEAQFPVFVAKMGELEPSSQGILTIDRCSHGKILYQQSVRFKDVKDKKELAEKVRLALLSMSVDLKKEQGRPVESYFMEVE